MRRLWRLPTSSGYAATRDVRHFRTVRLRDGARSDWWSIRRIRPVLRSLPKATTAERAVKSCLHRSGPAPVLTGSSRPQVDLREPFEIGRSIVRGTPTDIVPAAILVSLGCARARQEREERRAARTLVAAGNRVVWQRDVLDLALQELDVPVPPSAGSRARAPASRRSCPSARRSAAPCSAYGWRT